MNNTDHWLNYLSAAGIILAQTHFKGDWGVRMQEREGSYFHFLAQGSAWFSLNGTEETQMSPGDLVLLPQGASHQLRQSTDSQVVSLEQFVESTFHTRDRTPGTTTMVCGYFGIDRHMVMPAIKSLPAALHLRADSGADNSPIGDTLSQLRSEVESHRLGNKIIIRHLLSTLFIYVLREWSEKAPSQAGNWFSAMQDPHIARALGCIHKAPEDNWTLQRLASAAGLSRSAFIRRFQDSVGETPHAYLTRWRLGIAAQLLGQPSLSIGEIAYKVGYQSESAFNRAYKQARGRTPSKERESRQSAIAPIQTAVPA